MQLTFWGVRGSIATGGPQFMRVGGNTTCLEVQHGRDRLILDAGTGLRALGDKLMREARTLSRSVEASFLFSHLHWDHIQGFPFFAPAFVPTSEIQLFGPRGDDGVTSIEAALATQMSPPSFPVSLDAMPSQKRFATITDGDAFELGPFSIKTRRLCHPQGVLGFRIEAGGRSLCFATDTEHGDEGEVDEALMELARDVDLLVFDAQYTPAEYRGENGTGPSRKGWGHSTYRAAAMIARAAGAKSLALFHHDPTHDDDMVDAIEAEARQLFAGAFAAREQMTVQL